MALWRGNLTSALAGEISSLLRFPNRARSDLHAIVYFRSAVDTPSVAVNAENP